MGLSGVGDKKKAGLQKNFGKTFSLIVPVLCQDTSN